MNTPWSLLLVAFFAGASAPTARSVVESLIEKHFPAPDKKRLHLFTNKTMNTPPSPASGSEVYGSLKNQTEGMNSKQKLEFALSQLKTSEVEYLSSLKEKLLEKIDQIGSRLPCNTLDELIDQLGGADTVAEMTGRKGRVVRTESGAEYQSRCYSDIALDQVNITEKDLFMDGVKNIAVISEAASCGISLQSDRRVANQRRRVHITLELPWSADRAIQQFGRTHRSNQVNAPEYIFLISDLAGERRFASAVAKRLESLGALTHGDRRATDTRDLSRFNVDNKYGRQALTATLKAIVGFEPPLVPFPDDYPTFLEEIVEALAGVGIFIRNSDRKNDVSLDKDHHNIPKFLNRILGVPVKLQNTLFNYYVSVLESIIAEAKKMGRGDYGIKDLGAKGEKVTKVKTHTYLREYNTGRANTELGIFEVDRGLSFEDACNLWVHLKGPYEGFYMSKHTVGGIETALLAVGIADVHDETNPQNSDLYKIYRPHLGLTAPPITLEELQKKNRPITKIAAETPWKKQFDFCYKTCLHTYWSGNCKNRILGIECEYGMRMKTYHILTGSVLGVWSRIEAVLNKHMTNSNMQIWRVKTSGDEKTVGAFIPLVAVDDVIETLSNDAITPGSVDEEDAPARRTSKRNPWAKYVNRIDSDSSEVDTDSDDSDVEPPPLKCPKCESASAGTLLETNKSVPSGKVLTERVDDGGVSVAILHESDDEMNNEAYAGIRHSDSEDLDHYLKFKNVLK